jgi:hypothetical protein
LAGPDRHGSSDHDFLAFIHVPEVVVVISMSEPSIDDATMLPLLAYQHAPIPQGEQEIKACQRNVIAVAIGKHGVIMKMPRRAEKPDQTVIVALRILEAQYGIVPQVDLDARPGETR